MSGFPDGHPTFSFLTAEDWEFLNVRFHRIERLIRMATQAEVDAITSELTDAAGRIQAEIAQLESQAAAGQPVDLTALKAEADALANIAPVAVTEPAPADTTPADTTPAPDESAPPA